MRTKFGPTGSATPYTPDELEAVRPIIEAYNRPGSVQRRLLATLDQKRPRPLEVRRVVEQVLAEDRGVSGPEALAVAVVDALFGWTPGHEADVQPVVLRDIDAEAAP